MLKIATLKFT